MRLLQRLLQPNSKWTQTQGDPMPGAPTKDFYRYLFELDAKVREQEQLIADLTQRVTDLETP